MVSAFTRYSCLFIGYSFVDPALQHVLALIEKRLSPNFPDIHMALVPSNIENSLVTTLKKLNIHVQFYMSDDQHTVLWDAIKLAAQKLARAKESKPVDAHHMSLPIEGIKRYISATYSYMQMVESEEREFVSLRDIAVDGVLIGMLTGLEDGKEGKELITEIKQYFHIPEEDAVDLFERRIGALAYQKYLDRVGDKVILLKKPEKSLAAHLSELVKGAIERLQVREGQKPTKYSYEITEKVIEGVLLARSWDLGAYFAGATNGDIPNVFFTIQEQVERYAPLHYSSVEKQALTRAIYNLFDRPDDKESELLGDLGRVSFSLQLITNNPCSILAYSEILPEKIYLDSSVLMPAIVDGHPYSPVYRDAINRLRRATLSAGKDLSLWVAKDFLNEVIAHRRLAIREINELGLFNPNELERHISFYGAENSNVFIAAYSGRVGRTRESIKFDDFLREVAPYTTEDQLASFIKAKEGINTLRITFSSEDESRRANEINIALRRMYDFDYEKEGRQGYESKDSILIDHEANQLSKLITDLEMGIKAMFVTADQRFRRLASNLIPGKLGSAIISHRGLVQLIDLLLGVRTDPVSFSRLIWGGGFDEQTAAMYNYFTDIALRHYNDAYAMALPDVLGKITEKMNKEARQQQIDFKSKLPSAKARTIRFMDRFENEFYTDMAHAIQKKSPEDASAIQASRVAYLEDKISTITSQIRNLEDMITHSRRRSEATELRNEIQEQNLQLIHFKDELIKLKKSK